jgi:hypothetical protein
MVYSMTCLQFKADGPGRGEVDHQLELDHNLNEQRARRERPRCGRAAERRDELAPPYAGHQLPPASAPPV